MKSLLLLSAGVAALATTPAFAEGHNTVLSGGTGVQLSFSGQVNRGVLFTDDGEETSSSLWTMTTLPLVFVSPPMATLTKTGQPV